MFVMVLLFGLPARDFLPVSAPTTGRDHECVCTPGCHQSEISTKWFPGVLLSVQVSWMLQADICVVSEGLSNEYQVFLEVDAAQKAEILKARQTADSIGRYVENLETFKVLQPFNHLQPVPTLDAERKEDVFKSTRTWHSWICMRA